MSEDTGNEIKWKSTYDNLGQFLKKVYITSGLGIFGILLISGLIGKYLANNFILNSKIFATNILVGFIFSLIASVYISATNINMRLRIHNSTGTISTDQSLSRKIAYITFVISNGLLLSPVMAYYIAWGNELNVLAAIILASLTTIGTVLYVLNMKERVHEIGPIGAMLFNLLFSSVIMGLLSAIAYPYYPEFTAIWYKIDIYIGIWLFTMITAYDTYKAIKMHRNMDPDYIKCSVDFCLDFINLFLRILEALPKKRKN